MLKLQQETNRMHTMTNIRRNFLLALALSLPLAAQVPAGDYLNIRIRANAALESGNYSDAEKLYGQALESRRQAFGENSAPYAAALVDLARAYQANGKRSADAMSLYRQALPIQEAALGADHPDVATTLYYLAMGTPRDAEHKDQAVQLYQRALDIRTKNFGASDPRVAEILTPLAGLTGDETLYQRALAIMDASAPQSAGTATALETYSRFLVGHDRGGEAQPMEARAKQIRTTRVAEIGSRRGTLAPSLYRVGSGITPPRVQQKSEPEYTDAARADKLSGTVILQMEVGTDGLAHNIQLKQGIGMGLDEKAAEALSKWVFVPGTKDGQPVAVAATVEVNFRLL
jgi:TonB family protein